MIILYFVRVFVLVTLVPSPFFCVNFSLSHRLFISCDHSSFIFFATLVVISSRVLLWSYSYIDSEARFSKFTALLIAFLLRIFGLVFRSELLTLLVFWDLLGFTSFFLVVFFRSRSSLSGGLLTGLTNRIGDCLLLVCLGLRFASGSSLLFSGVLLLVLASFTKSAQVPFSAWLPAAIVAPTPVSALVHSSTLVTAGVYLLYRFVSFPRRFLLGIGSFTIVVSGISACLSTDLKKIIALSTLSQLGIMVVSLGLGAKSLCFGHLITHAYFKALLFMVVGTVIHACYAGQEWRCSGFIFCGSPLLIICATTSVLSMVGLVFLSGSVSKEAILVTFYNGLFQLFYLCMFYLGIFLTGVYSFRLLKSLVGSDLFLVSPGLFAPCGILVSLPILILLFFAIRQGYFLMLSQVLVFSALNYSDVCTLFIIALGWFFIDSQAALSLSGFDVLSTLFCSTRSLAVFSSSNSTVRWTENIELVSLQRSNLLRTFPAFDLGIGKYSRLILILLFVLFLL